MSWAANSGLTTAYIQATDSCTSNFATGSSLIFENPETTLRGHCPSSLLSMVKS